MPPPTLCHSSSNSTNLLVYFNGKRKSRFFWGRRHRNRNPLPAPSPSHLHTVPAPKRIAHLPVVRLPRARCPRPPPGCRALRSAHKAREDGLLPKSRPSPVVKHSSNRSGLASRSMRGEDQPRIGSGLPMRLVTPWTSLPDRWTQP